MNAELKEILNRYPRIKQVARRLAAIVPLSARLGKRFWVWYAFFEESQDWPVDKIRDFQLERIRLLLSEVIQTSKFYAERLSTRDVNSISSLADFSAKIPLLSRAEFRAHYAQILGSSWQTQRVVRAQTSGTTGMALQFYHRADDWPREWAAICHQWKRVGYNPSKSKVAQFRGLTTASRLIDLFPDQNTVRCSIIHMKPEHIRQYAAAIRRYQIDFYHVYPSALYLLCKVIHDYNIAFPQPRAILLASEVVHDWQLDQIRLTFPSAKLFAHYGCAERTVLAGWCEYRREYHVMPQYAFVEVDSASSEILGTNLYNTINAFLRYRMTDTVLAARTEPCPDCGRSYVPRILTLGGRIEDYLYSAEHGWIAPAVITYPFKGLKIVHETQLWQRERNRVTIRYTVRPQSNAHLLEAELSHIADGMHHLLGSDALIDFEQVDDFARSSSGKFKWIISELPGPSPDYARAQLAPAKATSSAPGVPCYGGQHPPPSPSPP